MINPSTELRKWLKEKNLSQVDLAQELGASEGYISMVLSGKRAPGSKILELLGLKKRVRITYYKVEER